MSQPSTTDSFTQVASSSLPVDGSNELNEVVGLDFHDEDEEENRAPPRRLLRAECILAKRTNRFIVVVETIQGHQKAITSHANRNRSQTQ